MLLSLKAVKEQWEPELFLAQLCEIEATHRQEVRLKRLLKESQLPIGKQLSQYDFSEVVGISAVQVKRKASELSWLRQGHNILLFGASGLGKTHIAAALGYALIEQSVRVKFTTGTAMAHQMFNLLRLCIKTRGHHSIR
ncbi:ATP-binding protein [Shewanella benthica]|nr:ATP-binding protein [Shewanella benthica]